MIIIRVCITGVSFPEEMTFGIMPGMTGILVTCNRNKESMCVKEMYKLLGEYDGFKEDNEGSLNKVDGEEIEDALLREVAELKDRKNKPFLSIGLGKGTGCLVFIKLASEYDPVEVAVGLLTNQANNNITLKSTQRLLPMQAICYANLVDFTKMAKQVLKERLVDKLSTGPRTFSILIEKRMNDSLSKPVIIQVVGDLLSGTPNLSVDLKRSDTVIMVQVLRNICGISVIDGYYGADLNKMNIHLK